MLVWDKLYTFVVCTRKVVVVGAFCENVFRGVEVERGWRGWHIITIEFERIYMRVYIC